MMTVEQPDWSIEDEAMEKGFVRVAGVDEAGRGPWAGPVVAGAFVVSVDARVLLPNGINDSKKMKPQARAELYLDLKQNDAWDTGIGEASVEEIDDLNILQATFLAMQRAVASLDQSPDYLLIDGKLMPAFVEQGHAVIKGDSKSLSIAAASILAKEHRDLIMIEQVEKDYPGYGFAKHKGYGTKQHRQALSKLGVCPLHRKSFAPIRKLLS